MEDSQTVRKAEEKISELGLPLPERPSDDATALEWPLNVGDLSPEDLAEHMSWWSGWSGFARYHLARAETNASAVSEEYDRQKSKRIYQSQGDYESVTALKAAVEQMPDMQRLKAKVLAAKALKVMVRSLLDGYEDKYATISREISRRSKEIEEARSRFKT